MVSLLLLLPPTTCSCYSSETEAKIKAKLLAKVYTVHALKPRKAALTSPHQMPLAFQPSNARALPTRNDLFHSPTSALSRTPHHDAPLETPPSITPSGQPSRSMSHHPILFTAFIALISEITFFFHL